MNGVKEFLKHCEVVEQLDSITKDVKIQPMLLRKL